MAGVSSQRNQESVSGDLKELVHLYPSVFPPRLQTSVIKARVEGAGDPKATSTMLDVVKAVSVLERWMWSKYSELRQVETILPAELDQYLQEFYKVLKKGSGRDYEPSTLKKYRFCVGRFLKENGYAHCPVTSSMFEGSRRAFKRRY